LVGIVHGDQVAEVLADAVQAHGRRGLARGSSFLLAVLSRPIQAGDLS